MSEVVYCYHRIVHVDIVTKCMFVTSIDDVTMVTRPLLVLILNLLSEICI